MPISVEVNLFCLSIIIIFVIFLILKYFQNLFSDSTAFWTHLGKNVTDKPDNSFVISVVYPCDGSIKNILEQLKTVQKLYEQNFQLDKKLEIIVIYDVRHENITDIRLLNKVFPNLVLMSSDLCANEGLSPKNFLAAAYTARGEYIVEAKTFAEEIDKLQQKPKNYISIFNSRNRFYFSAISKSSFEYMKRIHFLNTIPVEEFIIISKKMKIPYTVLNEKSIKNGSIFTYLYTNFLINLADFCYVHKIWKLPQEVSKGEKLKNN